MPAYAMTLNEYLTKMEMENLLKCLHGEDDLYVDHHALFEKLYEYYLPDMPYGTAKARTGDPDVWIIMKVQIDLGYRWVRGESGKMILVNKEEKDEQASDSGEKKG